MQVDPDPIWIRAGQLYTSAGVTAGMDLALALVEDDLGHAASLAVARELVLFLRRPGSQAQFSTLAAGAERAGVRNYVNCRAGWPSTWRATCRCPCWRSAWR
ncbi:hypothetical protein ACU4GD_36280 [Cupriavidus basilensis]